VYDAVSIEDRNKPTVTLVNYGFASDAESASRGKGMPVLRYIPTTVPCEASIMEDIESGVDGVFDDMVDSLTKPLTAEEESPKPKQIEKPTRIIFKGSLEEVNRFFYQRGWTDGLPILPPTEEAVADMLTGTDLPPDHLLGKLISRLGKATIEKIAINAVMAGALPTYMPVLIAGTKLLLESEPGFMGFGTFGFSTGSWAPFWIINGPVRNDLHVNHSSGALSPGNIANAAIGRAMGLIIKNIGGVRKGVEDMGVMGNPMKYSMVIAENEEESPWEPLHVEYGYKQDESTITLSFPQTYIQHWPYSADAEGILRAVMDHITRGMRYTFIFTPPHAKNLAREAWTKEDIKEFISEYARIPGSRFNNMPGIGGARPGLYKGKISARDTDTVGLIRDPRFIRIIVAGGPGAFIAHVVGGGATPGKKQTQKIELPKNWDKLVAKYKHVVPTYAKY
jgi:hypothetical protein